MTKKSTKHVDAWEEKYTDDFQAFLDAMQKDFVLACKADRAEDFRGMLARLRVVIAGIRKEVQEQLDTGEIKPLSNLGP